MECSCRFDLPDLVGGRAPCPPPGLRPRRAAQRTHGQMQRRARRSRAMRGRTPGAAPRDRGTRDPGAGRHLDQATDDVGRARAGDRPDPPPPRHATARRPANGSGNQRRCAQAPTTSDGPRQSTPPGPRRAGTRPRRPSAPRVVPGTAGPPHTATSASTTQRIRPRRYARAVTGRRAEPRWSGGAAWWTRAAGRRPAGARAPPPAHRRTAGSAPGAPAGSSRAPRRRCGCRSASRSAGRRAGRSAPPCRSPATAGSPARSPGRPGPPASTTSTLSTSAGDSALRDELGRVVRPVDDVDLLAVQLGHHRADPRRPSGRCRRPWR